MIGMADIAQRFEQNPILRPADIKPSLPDLQVECLLNPGVFRYNDKIGLLIRVAERPVQKEGLISFPVLDGQGSIKIKEFNTDDPDINLSDPRIIQYKGNSYLTTMSHLHAVYSEDGIHFTNDDPGLVIFGEGALESFGIEDCRVSNIGATYYLTYTQVSESGVGVGLMSTKDWREINRHGMIIPPHNKDCAIFEEKIDNKYFCFHRPSGVDLGGNFIWIASSPDLLHWSDHRCIVSTRDGMWDSARVGAGGPPIRTSEGWLEIYHGADYDHRYCLGAILLDSKNPAKVLARSAEPIMEPIMPYEQTGFFGNVVFTNGQLVEKDRITIYYGASDEVICGAAFSIKEILNTLY